VGSAGRERRLGLKEALRRDAFDLHEQRDERAVKLLHAALPNLRGVLVLQRPKHGEAVEQPGPATRRKAHASSARVVGVDHALEDIHHFKIIVCGCPEYGVLNVAFADD
jgi:hypothetical protein